MIRKIIKVGNSKGVTFSKDMATLLGKDFQIGDFVRISVEEVIPNQNLNKETSHKLHTKHPLYNRHVGHINSLWSPIDTINEKGVTNV